MCRKRISSEESPCKIKPIYLIKVLSKNCDFYISVPKNFYLNVLTFLKISRVMKLGVLSLYVHHCSETTKKPKTVVITSVAI